MHCSFVPQLHSTFSTGSLADPTPLLQTSTHVANSL